MSLATAEETTIVVDFPSAMAYGDFMQNAKFVVMYNGAIQTLTPTADSTGGKVSAPDTQMIAYWREWETPAQQKQIALAPGRADWRLLAIYTEGDVYQLKPQDLEGLSCPMSAESTTSINNAIVGGEEVVFSLNHHIVKAKLINNKLQYYIMACNPAEDEWFVGYQNSDAPGGNTLTDYSCDSFDETAYDDWFIDWLTGSVGLLNPTAQYMGYMSNVEIPVGAIEV